MKELLSLAICCIFLLCSSSMADSQSLFRGKNIQSIANRPDEFHGAKIAIVARLNLEFERDVISSIECEKVTNEQVSELWVDIPKHLLKSADKLNHTNVQIFGKFDSKKKGHMGAFPGTIKVEKIERFSSEYCR